MLKKRVVKVLLLLLFSFYFVFSGFLSVDAFAYTGYEFYPCDVSGVVFDIYNSSNNIIYSSSYLSADNNNCYILSNDYLSNVSRIRFVTHNDAWNVIVDETAFDYYIAGSVIGYDPNVADFTAMLNNVRVFSVDHPEGSSIDAELPLDNLKIYHTDGTGFKGFSFSAKILFGDYSTINKILMYTNTGTVSDDLQIEFGVFVLPAGINADAANAAIIAAINSQTNQLSSDIGQASDDIQQSIEDQYSGDPETEFSVDDVITQHNEKMGVLSFGSDVMLQFLDMFQSANVGTAQLTLPGFNITVENVEYSVWPDYSFNFDQLNEWVPALMSVIRVMLPAFVWLMVLRYCINVFEKNFLSNGG